mgnify:CR=1 FL=1
MAVVKLFKETALPATIEPNSIYFVSKPDSEPYLEIYVSDNTGSTLRRVVTIDDVRNEITQALAPSNAVLVVNNIRERNALNPTTNVIVFVLDATGDPTVNSGAATYIYDKNNGRWIKIAEWESLDMIIRWDNIVGRPTSSPASIDNAVALAHNHPNKTQLDKIGEDSNGYLLYGGQYPRIVWDTVEW